MVGWHHWLNEHEFQQTPGYSEGQGGLVLQRIGHDLAMNSNKPYSKYPDLGINQCDKFPFLLGNFYFYRTFCNKRTVASWVLKVRKFGGLSKNYCIEQLFFKAATDKRSSVHLCSSKIVSSKLFSHKRHQEFPHFTVSICPIPLLIILKPV